VPFAVRERPSTPDGRFVEIVETLRLLPYDINLGLFLVVCGAQINHYRAWRERV
jgi:hypothetical protein